MQQNHKQYIFHSFLFFKRKKEMKNIFLWFVELYSYTVYSFLLWISLFFFQSPHSLCIYSSPYAFSCTIQVQLYFKFFFSITNKSPFFSLLSVSPKFLSEFLKWRIPICKILQQQHYRFFEPLLIIIIEWFFKKLFFVFFLIWHHHALF